MIDRQLSIIVSLLTGKHLKRDRLLKDGLFPSLVLFFTRKKYTRMLSGGSCRAGLCSGHHTFSLFYGLSDSLKPRYQSSEYIFTLKSLIGSINSFQIFLVNGQSGGFVFSLSKSHVLSLGLCWDGDAMYSWQKMNSPFTSDPSAPSPCSSSPHASTPSHAGFCTEQLPPVWMPQFPSPKFSCFSSHFPSSPEFPPMK